MPNPRSELLAKAEQAINGDRNVQYGDPRQDFTRTAAMWAAYLGVDIAAHDVAAMMALLKVSRIRWSPTKEDHWLDLAGYAACGWDCARPDEPMTSEREAMAERTRRLEESNARYIVDG